MTKEEFVKGYCERSGVTLDWLIQYKVALPCGCGDEVCDGWAMVTNNPDAIKTHMELYSPNYHIQPGA